MSAEESTQPPDLVRHHRNNLDHAKKVYLSLLFSTPRAMWSSAVEELNVEVIEKLKANEFIVERK